MGLYAEIVDYPDAVAFRSQRNGEPGFARARRAPGARRLAGLRLRSMDVRTIAWAPHYGGAGAARRRSEGCSIGGMFCNA